MGTKRKRHEADSSFPKLPKIPETHALQKRPLLRPPLPSKHAASSTPKVVYVSARTPFMSAIKRVQKLYGQADKRAAQSALSSVRHKTARTTAQRKGVAELDQAAYALAAEHEKGKRDDSRDEVVVRATGKAVDKALQVGMWFGEREEWKIRVLTGSVGAIDDIVLKDDGEGGGVDDDSGQGEKDVVAGDGAEPGAAEHGGQAQDGMEVPAMRLRYTSMVEILISRA